MPTAAPARAILGNFQAFEGLILVAGPQDLQERAPRSRDLAGVGVTHRCKGEKPEHGQSLAKSNS